MKGICVAKTPMLLSVISSAKALRSKRSFGERAAVGSSFVNSRRGERADIFRTRQGSLDPHLPYLDTQWEAGCRNGAELWRRLRNGGFRRLAARRG